MVQDVNLDKAQKKLSIQHNNAFRYCNTILFYATSFLPVKCYLVKLAGILHIWSFGRRLAPLKEKKIGIPK